MRPVLAERREVSSAMVLALLCLIACWSVPAIAAFDDSLPAVIEKIKPGVVGVASYLKTRSPPAILRGTGFAVADGTHVLTNAHVLPESVAEEGSEQLALSMRESGREVLRRATKVAVDGEHDIALLKVGGKPLQPLQLGDSRKVREGELYAFTGFPIGVVLGSYPVTHRGIISAISPIVIPALTPRQLNPVMLHRLNNPYDVFQLDATAYPGNSGSPLYDLRTGTVIGIINSVYVKETKESVLEKPSGISYAIPIKYAVELLRQRGLKP
jgi:serine protease Do